jgi:hypothetical protein
MCKCGQEEPENPQKLEKSAQGKNFLKIFIFKYQKGGHFSQLN